MCCNWWCNQYVVIMLIVVTVPLLIVIVVAVPMIIVMVPAHAFAVPLLIVSIGKEAVRILEVDKATIHDEPTIPIHVQEDGARRLHLR